MNIDAIKKLATLARLAITPAEEARFAEDIGSILAYIDVITTVVVPETGESIVFSETLREDVAIDQTEETREAIRANFPRRAGDYLVVPKVL